jgi:hypothetical protein
MPAIVAHQGYCFPPYDGHVAFTSASRSGSTLGIVRPCRTSQEVPVSTHTRRYVTGGIVALATGLVTGWLRA